MKNAKVLEKVITIEEDVTCYGNRFWIQVEDSETEDNRNLREFVDKEFEAILILKEKQK